MINAATTGGPARARPRGASDAAAASAVRNSSCTISMKISAAIVKKAAAAPQLPQFDIDGATRHGSLVAAFLRVFFLRFQRRRQVSDRSYFI